MKLKDVNEVGFYIVTNKENKNDVVEVMYNKPNDSDDKWFLEEDDKMLVYDYWNKYQKTDGVQYFESDGSIYIIGQDYNNLEVIPSNINYKDSGLLPGMTILMEDILSNTEKIKKVINFCKQAESNCLTEAILKVLEA